MPSSPKIPKETILEHALQMLIREGYAAMNIKTLAEEIGCSTQPISRHFGSMDGLRKELNNYALNYVIQKQRPGSYGMPAFRAVGAAYVDIAFDEPKLFQYLYMSADGGSYIGGFDTLVTAQDHAAMISQVAKHLEISEEKAGLYCRNMIVYTHGLASFVAAGLIKASKQEVYDMMSQASEGFLMQVGASYRE